MGLSRVETFHRSKQALRVGWGAKQIGGFLKGFVVIKREHNDSLVTISRNDHRGMVGANPVHRGGEIFSGGGIGNRCHMDSILHIPKNRVEGYFTLASLSDNLSRLISGVTTAGNARTLKQDESPPALLRSAHAELRRAGEKRVELLSRPEINLPYYVPHMRNFEGPGKRG